ncbi:AAA family ATPase [Streptomyces sp. CRN 30]|uniref:AAA family ATPase n=1 Tax=Streptomyces sp. CRN 30 TaxID=3075613 RepID=UPI002A83DD9A|nr:AAA family ATPase [Streptomyces sp. CRN 30]
MTAPLTPPPHDPSSHHAWHTAPGPGVAAAAAHDAVHEKDGPGMKTEVREAALITVGVALGGLLLGVLWWWLAPSVPLVSDGTAVYLQDSEGEQAIGVDGTFTLLALGLGALSGLVVFLLRRRGGVPLVLALTAGGLLGSVLAWRLGVWLGPTQNVVAHAKQVGEGVTFPAPVELNAKGALLSWSVAALVVHLGLTSLFAPRDPDPYEPYRGQDPFGAPPA